MDVGKPVRHAGAEVQEGRRRVFGHPGVTVGSAGDDAFKEAQDTAHPVHPVERCDKMHLRGARIGETDVYTAADQSAHETLRAVHDLLRIRVSRWALSFNIPSRKPEGIERVEPVEGARWLAAYHRDEK